MIRVLFLVLYLVSAILFVYAQQEPYSSGVGTRLGQLEKQGAELSATNLRQQNLLDQQTLQLKITDDIVKELRALVWKQSSEMATQKEKIIELTSRVGELSTHVKERNEFVEVVTAGIQVVRSDLRECIDSKTAMPSGEVVGQRQGVGNQTYKSDNGTSNQEKQTEHITGTTTRKSRFLHEGPFAFHAVSDRPEISHISIDQTIVFENVLTNIGGAFHVTHSLFIAEVPGMYLFSVSILTFVNDRSEFTAALVKNGNNLALVYGHGDAGRHDQGSVTVVTQLNTGDEVWVKMLAPNDGSIYGGRYTTFSGVLLYTL